MDTASGSALDPAQLDQLAINTIRFLSVDAVQKANSGHPAYIPWVERTHFRFLTGRRPVKNEFDGREREALFH